MQKAPNAIRVHGILYFIQKISVSAIRQNTKLVFHVLVQDRRGLIGENYLGDWKQSQ